MKSWLSYQHFLSALLALVPIGLYFFDPQQLQFRWGPQWTFLYFLPYAFFATAALLAQSLNQSRIVFVCATAMIVFLVASTPEFWPRLGVDSTQLFFILGAAFYVSASLIFISGESRYWSPKGVVRFVAVVLPVIVLWDLSTTNTQIVHGMHSWMPVAFNGRPSFPAAVFIAPILFLAISLIRNERSTKAFLRNSIIAFIPMVIALNHLYSRPIVVVGFLIVGALFLHGVVQLYWQRVYMDELTGIPNRRALEEKMYSINPDYTIAMVDIDHFKKFNDTYGHQEGDNVLRFVAEHLYQHTGGRAYRYGGEEFTVIFEKTSMEEVVALLDHAREDLAERVFHIRKPDGGPKETVHITISIGIAAPDDTEHSPKNVMEFADQALYAAKENGRDCVAVA